MNDKCLFSKGDSVFDENTITLYDIEIITEEQIETFIRNFLDRYYSITGTEITGKWRINRITNKKGLPLGKAFIYFSNKEMYHIFIGNNPDGTRKTIRIINPFYDKDVKIENVKIRDFDLNTPEFIEIPHQPNFIKPCILLDQKQATFLGRGYIEPRISPCALRPLKNSNDNNILFCRSVPSWITEEIIKDIFVFYVKDPLDVIEGYPVISFRDRGNDRSVRVTFKEGTKDSMFALVMNRKVKTSFDGKEFSMIFSYATKFMC